jgi:hypothetical protein
MENIAPKRKSPVKTPRKKGLLENPNRSPLKALAISGLGLDSSMQSPLAVHSYPGKKNSEKSGKIVIVSDELISEDAGPSSGKNKDSNDEFGFDDLLNESFNEENANPVVPLTRSAIKNNLRKLKQYLPSKKLQNISRDNSSFSAIIQTDRLFKSPGKEKDIRQMFSSTPLQVNRAKRNFSAVDTIDKVNDDIEEESEIQKEADSIVEKESLVEPVSRIEPDNGEISAEIHLFDDPDDLERTTDPSVSLP